MKILSDFKFNGLRVLCRLDFNVPFETDNTIEDTERIDAALPTIRYLLNNHAAQVIILSHRGEPTGYNHSLSLRPVADYLLSCFDDRVGNRPKIFENWFVNGLPVFQITDRVYLVENIRFLSGEMNNDDGLAKQMAKQADIYVFDAFATAHREQASTFAVANYLPHCAGLLVQKELDNLNRLLDNPNHPFVVLMGGAKIKDKLPVIKRLSDRVDKFLIGGAIANTILKAGGMDVHQSLVEDEQLELAKTLINQLGDKLVLPVDYVWDDGSILDIGHQTVLRFQATLSGAKEVFWNGNLGKTEVRKFSTGSVMVGDFLAKQHQTATIVSGGDTIGFLKARHLVEKMTFVSTGGGATLKFLAGETLPAINNLN